MVVETSVPFGLNVVVAFVLVASTPFPDHSLVPPAGSGVAVNVCFSASIHIGPTAATVAVGVGCTNISISSVPLHPFASLNSTVKVCSPSVEELNVGFSNAVLFKSVVPVQTNSVYGAAPPAGFVVISKSAS